MIIHQVRFGLLTIFLIKKGNLNIYPLNIFIHGAGALGWAIAGYLSKDKVLLTYF